MVKKATLLIFSYTIIAVLFWLLIGLNVLNGELDFKFYSDSKVYEDIALMTDNILGLLRISGNEFGPVVILKILGPENYTRIFLFNFLLLFISIRIFMKNEMIIKHQFLLLLLISPLTFTSIFAINKEIFVLLSTACLIRFVDTKKGIWIFFAVIISFFVRWQMILFFLVVLFTLSGLNPIHNRRGAFLILLLVASSIVLFLTRGSLLVDVFNKFEGAKENYDEGSGLFFMIMNIQDNFGYIFAFIPKIFHLLVGMTSRVKHLLNPDPVEMYNDVILFWQGPLNLFLIFTFFRKKMFDLSNDFVFIAFIYLIIFGMTPIYNIRYFYAFTIILSFIVSQKPKIDSFLHVTKQK